MRSEIEGPLAPVQRARLHTLLGHDMVLRSLRTLRLIAQGEPLFVVYYAPHILWAGLLMLGVTWLLDCPGIVAAVFAASLGAAGESFADWRTERGLWMLAVLFLSIFGLIWLAFVHGTLMDFYARPRWVQLVNRPTSRPARYCCCRSRGF